MKANMLKSSHIFDFDAAMTSISLLERDRMRTKVDLIRAEFFVEVLAKATNFLGKCAGTIKHGVAHTLSSRFGFGRSHNKVVRADPNLSHCAD